MKRILKTMLLCAVLGSSFSLWAGETTYDQGVKELRINSSGSVYVYLYQPIVENNCTGTDHYVLKANHGAYEQIKTALYTAYMQKKTVSFKNNGGCQSTQPVIKFMRLK